MNRYFLILLRSVLLFGALLPLCSLSTSAPTSSTQSESSNTPQLLAFGSGIPEPRSSGGTR